MTLDGNVARKEHGTPRNYRIYKVYGCESLNFRATILFILRSGTANDPRCEPQMIPPENNEWHGFWFLGFFFELVMFIFCLCDVGYWIRVNTV